MVNEEKKSYYMNRNIKIAPSYLALTWDVIFVWTISTMFFSTQKGLSYSQIISLDSILMFIGCVMCIPINKLFENVKPVVATRIGILGYGAYILLCIFGTSYLTFIFAQFFLAFAYCILSIKVNTVLNDSLSVVKKEKQYEKIYGKGLSLFYVIEAVGAIAITYVYTWNPYAAYWVSFGVVVISELLSFLLTEPSKFQERNIEIKTEIKTEVKSKPQKQKSSIKRILGSGFFICLLVYMFLMRGTLSITSSSFKVFLQQSTDAGVVPLWLFGYIFAGIKLSAAVSSKYQFKFNLKFGVRSLIIFTLATILVFAISGIVYLINPFSILSIVIICLLAYIQNAIYAPCRIFTNNYMQVCMPKKDVEKAYSIRVSVEYLGYAVISGLYAALLGLFNDNFGLTNLVYISILAIPLIISMTFFIRFLCKKYAQKYTIIKDEYTDD